MKETRICKMAKWDNPPLPQHNRRLTTVGREYVVVGTRLNGKVDIMLDDFGNEIEAGKYSAYFIHENKIKETL